MIMKKRILSAIVAAAMTLSFAACGGNSGGGTSGGNDNGGGTAAADAGNNGGGNSGGGESGGNSDNSGGGGASGETISLRVWGGEEDQNLLQELVENFKAAHPDQTFDITIGVESESTAKDTVLTDVEAAADVYAFASDQLNALVNGGALLAIDDTMDQVLQAYAGKSLADVKSANGEGSVLAASIGNTMYAFPMTGGNNYFLFYDSNVISPEQAQSWDTMLDAAAAAGKKVAMTLSSGWYNASFFLGAGFVVELNDDGTTYVDWNGTSADGYTGVQVVQAMQAIAAHSGFMAVEDGGLTNAISSGEVAAVVDGTWDATAASAAYGDGYAASKLPTFTVNGNQVQQACFSGFKFIGVNPHSQNAGWAVLLAEFLTNEESQVTRFNQRELAPTNIKASGDPAVAANVAVAASSAQDVAGGVNQTTGDKYWDPSASFGEQIAQGTIASDDASIQTALDQLVEGITAPIG